MQNLQNKYNNLLEGIYSNSYRIEFRSNKCILFIYTRVYVMLIRYIISNLTIMLHLEFNTEKFLKGPSIIQIKYRINDGIQGRINITEPR